jgi:hypothetical protein
MLQNQVMVNVRGNIGLVSASNPISIIGNLAKAREMEVGLEQRESTLPYLGKVG